MKFRSSVVASAGVALLFGWLLATPAFAECDADNAIFADDFQFLDGTWGDADDNYFVEDGYLVIKGWRAQVNFATKSDAADFCADITIADAPAPDSTAAGLVFWWADWDNYYYLYYWADGSMEVRRVVKGKDGAAMQASATRTAGVEDLQSRQVPRHVSLQRFHNRRSLANKPHFQCRL